MKRNPYPKYKPSGVEWMGYVPEHWEVKKLKFIGTSLIGLTYSPDDVVDEDYEGGKHLVLRSTNIQDGKISLHENVYVTTRVEKVLNVRKWDILICARNGSRHLVGKNALINETDNNMTFGAFTTVFRSKINPFLFYYFASNQFQYQSTGFLTTTINQLTNGNLNSIITTLPTLPEQQAITAFLDRKTGRIDTLIGKKQKFIELLKEKRTALISQAVTKGLDQKAKMKSSGVEWLGDVPEHWGVKKIKFIIKHIKIGPFGSDLTIDMMTDDGIKVYGQENLINNNFSLGDKFISEKKYEEMKIYTVDEDDILISMMGTIGKCRVVPEKFKKGIINSHLIKIKVNQSVVYSNYLALIINDSGYIDYEINRESVGTIMSGLNSSIVKSLSILLPPLSEQQAIISFLDREMEKIDSLVTKVEKAIEKLKEYRTALISAAVTGKIDVREVA